jgi:hypothetical protein
MEETGEARFIVWAEAEGHNRPLLMTDMSLARLFDDIVVPYQTGETFFLDGVPVKAKDLKRIKILRAKPALPDALHMFNRGLTRGEPPTRKIYGDQHHVRYEAILRDHSEDVTAQIIKAYDRAIKPSIKDYLPKREELIGAAVKVFVEAMKSLGAA